MSRISLQQPFLRSRIPNPKWRDGASVFSCVDNNSVDTSFNTALCVGFKFEYVTIRTYNPYTAEKITVVMASDLVGSYFKKEGETLSLEEYKQGDKVLPYRIVGRFSGEDLIGMHYQQLMPWVKPVEKLNEYSATYVTEFAEANPVTFSQSATTAFCGDGRMCVPCHWWRLCHHRRWYRYRSYSSDIRC